MKAGRFFTDQENAHHMPVAVIGEDVQKQLLRKTPTPSANGSRWTATRFRWSA